MKLLILIATDRVIPHNIKLVDEGIFKTWASRSYENIQILSYYGGNSENKITNNAVQVVGKAVGLENIYDNTMTTFRLVYDNLDFDVILRTNVSTYIRPDYLHSILKKQNLKDFFGSTWCHPLDEKCYFSGISLLFSRDVIKKIIDANVENSPDLIDDVLLGKIIASLYPNYEKLYRSFKRLDMMENSLIRLNDFLFKINYSNIWAFRCKTAGGGLENRDLDIEKMKLLDKIFYI